MSEQRSTRIVVNGQEYHSIEEMPPDVRALYREAMRMAAEPAAPDEEAPAPAGASPPLPDHTRVTLNKVVTKQKFVVNGQEYASLDALPPELAEEVRRALGTSGPQALAGSTAQATRPAKPASRIPNFDARAGSRVRLRVSGLRLALWVVAILLIILLYLRSH